MLRALNFIGIWDNRVHIRNDIIISTSLFTWLRLSPVRSMCVRINAKRQKICITTSVQRRSRSQQCKYNVYVSKEIFCVCDMRSPFVVCYYITIFPFVGYFYEAQPNRYTSARTRSKQRQSEKEMRNIENNLRRYHSTSLEQFFFLSFILPLLLGGCHIESSLSWCRLQTIITLNDDMNPLSCFSFIELHKYINSCMVFLSYFHRLFSSRCHASFIQIVMWCVHHFACPTNQRNI